MYLALGFSSHFDPRRVWFPPARHNALARDIRPRAHGNTNGRLGEYEGIIDAVPQHGHLSAAVDQFRASAVSARAGALNTRRLDCSKIGLAVA